MRLFAHSAEIQPRFLLSRAKIAPFIAVIVSRSNALLALLAGEAIVGVRVEVVEVAVVAAVNVVSGTITGTAGKRRSRGGLSRLYFFVAFPHRRFRKPVCQFSRFATIYGILMALLCLSPTFILEVLFDVTIPG